MTQEWAQPKDAEHLLYKAAGDVRDSEGHILLTAYALHRPDGQWSLLLINKDYDHPHPVRIVFHDSNAGQDMSFAGQVSVITFGKQQYQWHSNRKKGYADPDGPPKTSTLEAMPDTIYDLSPASVTVLRGAVSASAR
jgi:hypothetical protein